MKAVMNQTPEEIDDKAFVAVDSPAPMVSICVPTYNGARYLDDCLKGIFAQTFKDFEVLIVDDCSKDQSAAIVRTWMNLDARVRLHVNEVNQGLVENWNRCIKLARGQWIKFLFQDDLMEPECLASMLAVGQSGGGFVACARNVIYSGVPDEKMKAWFSDHERRLQAIYSNRPEISADEYSREKLAALEFNIVGEPSVTLIQRSLFQSYGYFDPLLIQLCDSEMWNRLACNVGIQYLSEKLVSFRVHGNSATQSNQSRKFRAGTLDEIVEWTRLATSPQLAKFRRYSQATGEWRWFKIRLRRRVNAAFEEARLAREASPPNNSLTQDLYDVLPELPGFTARRLIYMLYRLRIILKG